MRLELEKGSQPSLDREYQLSYCQLAPREPSNLARLRRYHEQMTNSKGGKNIRKSGKDANQSQCFCQLSEFTTLRSARTFGQQKEMSSKNLRHDRNEKLIRRLYHFADAATKDTAQFVSLFADSGYFYDVSSGKKYYGVDIGLTVDVYAAAFPDMHRELDRLYFDSNVVIVELSLNGTHNGNLPTPKGIFPPTGKKMHAPCCDVFHIKNEKVTSFHCYLTTTVIQAQLGLT